MTTKSIEQLHNEIDKLVRAHLTPHNDGGSRARVVVGDNHDVEAETEHAVDASLGP